MQLLEMESIVLEMLFNLQIVFSPTQMVCQLEAAGGHLIDSTQGMSQLSNCGTNK